MTLYSLLNHPKKNPPKRKTNEENRKFQKRVLQRMTEKKIRNRPNLLVALLVKRKILFPKEEEKPMRRKKRGAFLPMSPPIPLSPILLRMKKRTVKQKQPHHPLFVKKLVRN